tara:strand:+ start:71 stop:454 length:384 start_codon:yes stop_codon:yes gene_type:complete
MKDTWHNNRISKKLNEDFPKDFSLCDIDGAIRCHYKKNNEFKTRFIVYESKNKTEKKMGSSQKQTLKTINEAIDWNKFDEFSGLFILKIIDLENIIHWYNIKGELIRTTTFTELYNIFSCKENTNIN